MKGITILISLLCLISLLGLINADDLTKAVASELEKMLNELNKPSKAFTVVLMIYMCLIIIGAVLVVVLIKPKIDN